MSNRLNKKAISLTHGLRRLTAPPGKRYVALDENLAVRGNQILVSDRLDEAALQGARRDFVREQWAGKNQWALGPVKPMGATHPALPFALLPVGLITLAIGLSNFLFGVQWFPLPVRVFMLIFSTLWCFLLGMVILQNRKFRPGEITLDAVPVPLGGTLSGRLRTGVDQKLGMDGLFTLTLRCVRVVRSSSSSGAPRESTTTVWSHETSDRGVLAQGDTRYSVSFNFSLPDDQMPWTLGSGVEGYRWELLVAADMPGLNYVACFLIPVLSARDYAYVCESAA